MYTQDVLRKKMRTLRDALTETERATKSKHIADRLLKSELFQQASTIALYYAYGSEVATESIITTSWQQNKCVAIPYILGPGEMIFLEYLPDSVTKTNRYGILEIDPLHGKEISATSFDCMILPGLVFSAAGDRIGYGGGFYDRYQKKLSSTCKRLALAFDCQISHTPWPVQETDIPVHYVLTETSLLKHPEAPIWQ